MSRIALPTGTRGWGRAPSRWRRRDVLFGFRAAGLELVDLATGQPISFSRASPGGLVPVLGGSGASRGTVLSGPHAHDVPRFAMLDRDGDGAPETPALWLEGSSTNQIRNPRGEGAVVGTLGSGGALPTFWAPDTTAGLTWEVVATGVEDGLPYVDVRLHGTPSQTFAQLRFDGTTAIAAAPGETWTGSFYARRVGGSMAGIGEARVRIQERDASGVFLNQSQSVFDPDDSPRLAGARRTYTHTVSDPNAAAIVLVFGLGGLTVDNAIDVTFRIGAPQLEQMPFATSPILPPIGAPAVATRATELLTADVTAQLAGRRSFAIYHRFEERGTIILRNWMRALSLESDAGALRIWAPGSGAATYEAYVGSGLNAKIPSGTPALRQTVEHLMIVAEDGTLTFAQSIDGGPVVAATGSHGGYVPTGTVTLAWGSTASGSNHGALAGRDLLVLDGAGWTMDAVRNRFGIAV